MTLAGAQRIVELENEIADLRRQLAIRPIPTTTLTPQRSQRAAPQGGTTTTRCHVTHSCNIGLRSSRAGVSLDASPNV